MHLSFEADGRLYWEYLPNYQHYYFAVIHQPHTLNKSIFPAKDFTLEDALLEADHAADILYRTIKYFKNRGKYVVVFGHSYSAWVVQHYLATRPSIADKYLITGGRLNADPEQTALQQQGINTGFEEDGKTLLVPKKNSKPKRHRTQRYFTIRKNKELLKYALGKTRYTEALGGVDLSNLIYYYGKEDQNVGALTKDEIAFLKNKKATVKGVETGHYDIWKRVVDAFREGRLQL